MGRRDEPRLVRIEENLFRRVGLRSGIRIPRARDDNDDVGHERRGRVQSAARRRFLRDLVSAVSHSRARVRRDVDSVRGYVRQVRRRPMRKSGQKQVSQRQLSRRRGGCFFLFRGDVLLFVNC